MRKSDGIGLLQERDRGTRLPNMKPTLETLVLFRCNTRGFFCPYPSFGVPFLREGSVCARLCAVILCSRSSSSSE